MLTFKNIEVTRLHCREILKKYAAENEEPKKKEELDSFCASLYPSSGCAFIIKE